MEKDTMTYAARHGRDDAAPGDTARTQELIAAAQAWVDDDPDHESRVELGAVLGRAKDGDEAAVADLADRFSGLLEFGTAGLRGALGAGPNRMNRAVVIRAAAGLTAYLKATAKAEPFVVAGYDARRGSDVFARDTAAVVVGAGGRAAVLPHTLPTPVLAFTIRYLGADAGVMVTASHNPPQDNGYKVYLGDGSQIVPPADIEIAGQIARVQANGSVDGAMRLRQLHGATARVRLRAQGQDAPDASLRGARQHAVEVGQQRRPSQMRVGIDEHTRRVPFSVVHG